MLSEQNAQKQISFESFLDLWTLPPPSGAGTVLYPTEDRKLVLSGSRTLRAYKELRGSDRVNSPAFPNLQLTAEQILKF